MLNISVNQVHCLYLYVQVFDQKRGIFQGEKYGPIVFYIRCPVSPALFVIDVVCYPVFISKFFVKNQVSIVVNFVLVFNFTPLINLSLFLCQYHAVSINVSYIAQPEAGGW